jgi:hypothetical protein
MAPTSFSVHLYDETCMNLPAQQFSRILNRSKHTDTNNPYCKQEATKNYEAAQRYANQADCAGYNIQVIHGGD